MPTLQYWHFFISVIYLHFLLHFLLDFLLDFLLAFFIEHYVNWFKKVAIGNKFCMASGRFFGIKKTTLLKIFAMLAFFAFVAYIFLCIFWLKDPMIWFFGFCIFLGGFEIIKSFLFRFDSSLYFGSLLSSIGVLGFVFISTGTSSYAGYYIALAFILASLVTYVFSGQKFHLIVAFSTFFVSLYSLLLTKNLITTSNFVAIVVPFLVLLISEMIIICFFRKR